MSRVERLPEILEVVLMVRLIGAVDHRGARRRPVLRVDVWR
jgi:hypothetical protein